MDVFDAAAKYRTEGVPVIVPPPLTMHTGAVWAKAGDARQKTRPLMARRIAD